MKNSTLLALTAIVALAGCGGGGGGDSGGGAASTPPASAEVPASASLSVEGFVNYLTNLFASDADSLPPVDVSMVTPVQSDEASPTAVD